MHNPNNMDCPKSRKENHWDYVCLCPKKKEEWENTTEWKELYYAIENIEWDSEDHYDGALFVVDTLKDFIRSQISLAESRVRKEVVDENTSDGYHTFKELYEFRKVYNAVLFNEWAKQCKYAVHKSIRHGDGELAFDGGWFIVMATLPTGQISNHYEMKDWDLFQCEEKEKADVWDGHTAHDVVLRMLALEDVLAKISQV